MSMGHAAVASPFPLVGEGGIGGLWPPLLSAKNADALHRLRLRSSGETDEGSVSADRDPSSAFAFREGTFSHKGRREVSLTPPSPIPHRDASTAAALRF